MDLRSSSLQSHSHRGRRRRHHRWAVRKLAETRHPLGILSLGTFNNFAKSLHLPTTVDAAIRVIKTGKLHPITLGCLNGKLFLEAAAIGLFGETIAAGESAKDRAFGAFAEDVKHIAEARPFTYELTGDIRGSGSCMSLVFTNTTSIGSQMPVSDKTPKDPYLALSVHAGAGHTNVLKRVLASAIPSKHKGGWAGIQVPQVGGDHRSEGVHLTATPSKPHAGDHHGRVSVLKVSLPR
jgi:diacylglycerol kinase family enzyme